MEKFRKIKNVLNLSVMKTIRMNYKYFGIKYIFRPIILVSRNTKIYRLKGKVISNNKSFGAIRIGFGRIGIVDSRYRRAIWDNDGIVEFKGNAFLGVGTKITNTGSLVFGDKFTINANSDIVCKNSIFFGDDVLISWESLIMDSDYHCIYDVLDDEEKSINQDKPVCIGNHCWIGCRCVVLKGTVISDNCVVAAGSIVSKNYKAGNVIISSNGILKDNVNWKR